MPKKLSVCIMVMVFVIGVLAAVSCSKNTIQSESSLSQSEPVKETGLTLQAEGSNIAEIKDDNRSSTQAREPEDKRFKDAQRLQSEETWRNETSARKVFPNELILFDFDSSSLTAGAQESLKRKALWLTENPEVSIKIEGHCDERGTEAYNLGLGERRARAVEAFLVGRGVSSARLSTASYGEKRPFARGHDESAWKLNRRAHFVVE
ncbi:MAG: peptidoglycan-associated lipoprotein Pal [Thermodesulfobacteriota bacterium]